MCIFEPVFKIKIERMKKLSIISLVVLVLMMSCKTSRIDIPEVTAGELKEHIEYLASDELKGRLPGTEGDLLAAAYIRDLLRSWGLEPLCDNGLQEVEIIASVTAGENCSLNFDNTEYIPGKDFAPLSFSESAELDAELVFAGYGFAIDSESQRWNDYENIDVSNKWVMILRADPEVDNPMSAYAAFSSDRDKAMLAKDKGAAGVILVSGKMFDPKDEFENLRKGEFSVGIPVIRVSRELANKILGKTSEKTIEILEEELNNKGHNLSFTTGTELYARVELVQEIVNTHNVIMKLPGNDPLLKEQYTLIGGHYDHLGMGGPGTSSRAVDTVAVHYGADDNASGIAAMLEIAEKFAATRSNRRSVIFAAFAAEEMGLLGSKHMVKNLPFEADSINAMLNLDMVGRLNENHMLQVGGVGTSPSFDNIVRSFCDTSFFKLSISTEGYGPSDHSSFYGEDIPVLFISTGAHLDYHTPYDSPDKINYDGMVKISDLVYTWLSEFSNMDERLDFTEAGPKTQVNMGMRRKGVSLGIMPDFAGNIKNGLRADFITPGKPAQLGGMKKGDIITAINGLEINNIQDYMFRLSKLQHGETINVEILRDGKKELLLIKL